MEFGPVQLLVVGFTDGKFSGEILAELRRLREHDIIRLVDLMFVSRDESGEFEAIEHSDLPSDEAEAFGAMAGALLGLDEGEAPEPGSALDSEDVWFLADAIPPGTSAGIALLEHRWAIPLRDAIERAGGQTLADAWVHPRDLIEIGAGASG